MKFSLNIWTYMFVPTVYNDDDRDQVLESKSYPSLRSAAISGAVSLMHEHIDLLLEKYPSLSGRDLTTILTEIYDDNPCSFIHYINGIMEATNEWTLDVSSDTMILDDTDLTPIL